MSSEYGEEPSVIDAIHELHNALGMRYMRPGLQINLEPDAFFRLQNEIKGKSQMESIHQDDFAKDTIILNTPAGELKIVKDDKLGTNSYIPTWPGTVVK